MTKESRGLLIGVTLGLALCWTTAQAQPPAPPAPPRLPPAALPPATTPTNPGTPNVLPPPGPSNPATGPAPATITIMVPATATIWIGEQQMKQTGTRRTFQSPPLDPTKTYAYTMKISWGGGTAQKDNVTEQEVTIRAGQTTIIDFTPLAQGMASGAPPSTPLPNQATPPNAWPQPPARGPGFLRRVGGSRP